MKTIHTLKLATAICAIFAFGCNQHINKKSDSADNSVEGNTSMVDVTGQDEEVIAKLWTSAEFRNNRDQRYRSLEDAYANPDNVVNLAVYSKFNGEIPSDIDTFKNVQLLGLDYNELSELPSSIGNLLYLQKIHLNKNEFTEFPHVLTQCRYLKTILISDNQIETITPDIKNLVFLEDLVMNDNNLGEVPPELFELTHLKVLGLRENGIGELPDKFDQLPNLEKLNLQNNNIKELPESLVMQGNNLQRITLKGNPMSIGYVNEIRKRMPSTEIEF